MTNPYQVLGVSPDASEEEITRAYRALAKKYHPDLNPGDEVAAKKMAEVNAAYEQIKSGGAQSASHGAGQQRQQQYGDPFGGFGFDPFGYYGYSERRQHTGRSASPFDPVRRYINAGYYAEALNVLSGIKDHTAEWYYYSALANWGAGNKVLALNHIHIACQQEPDNQIYRDTMEQMQSGKRTYSSRSRGCFLCNDLCCLYFFCNLIRCFFCR